MKIEITIDDAKAYTTPWTVTLHQAIKLDTDLLELICSKNEKRQPPFPGEIRVGPAD